MEIKRTFVIDKEAYRQTINELSLILAEFWTRQGRPKKEHFMATWGAFQKLEPHQVAGILESSLKWQNDGYRSRSMAVWCMRKRLLTPHPSKHKTE